MFHIAKAMGRSIAQTFVCAMTYRHDACVGTIGARPCQSGLAESCFASGCFPLILHAEAGGAKGSRCKNDISCAKAPIVHLNELRMSVRASKAPSSQHRTDFNIFGKCFCRSPAAPWEIVK